TRRSSDLRSPPARSSASTVPCPWLIRPPSLRSRPRSIPVLPPPLIHSYVCMRDTTASTATQEGRAAPRAGAGSNDRNGGPSTEEQPPELRDQEAHREPHRQRHQRGDRRPLHAPRLLVDRVDRRRTGVVEQTEEHEADAREERPAPGLEQRADLGGRLQLEHH